MDRATAWLKETLGYEFRDDTLLRKALTHRSANQLNYERLEFLGDAVLQVVVSELVFEKTQDANEGQLSRLRSSLVKATTLTDLASELGIGEHLVLGSGEKKSGGHHRSSILADALEAIFEHLPASADLRDPKSRLQEYLQGRKMALPEYELQSVSGKAHKQSFEVSCRVAEIGETTIGRGRSRRGAEQEAAAAMLALVEDTHE